MGRRILAEQKRRAHPIRCNERALAIVRGRKAERREPDQCFTDDGAAYAEAPRKLVLGREPFIDLERTGMESER